MDNVSIILCMCIGNMVAWLMAIYTERGAYNLLWNFVLGTAGAVLCGLVVVRLAPDLGVAGFLAGGPVCAILMIRAGHTAWRHL